MSATIAFQSTFGDTTYHVLKATDINGNLLDYSSNNGQLRYYEIDVTKLFTIATNLPRVVTIKCEGVSSLELFGKGNNLLSNRFAPCLIVKCIFAFTSINDCELFQKCLL